MCISNNLLFFCRPNKKLFYLQKQVTKLKLGDIITYKCLSTNSYGVPKNAEFVRLRVDLTWEDVCDYL